MNVLAVNKVLEASTVYPSAYLSILGWYQIIINTDFSSPESLRNVFGDMRGFNSSFQFPIPVSSLLIHTQINFDAGVVLIDSIKPGHH